MIDQPTETIEQAYWRVEAAYGMLLNVQVDRSTVDGLRTAAARQLLLEAIGPDGAVRGKAAAEAALAATLERIKKR